MSDENTPAAGVPSPAPSPPASEPPVSTGGGDLEDLPADQALFPRGYVEKLRGEAQKYRTEAETWRQKATTYDDVYGVYEENDRQAWMDLARTWAVDPNRAAQVMDQIARSVLEPDTGAGNSDTEPDDGKNGDGNGELGRLTPEEVQKMIADALNSREETAAQQKAVENIYGELRGAGYDPESREGFMVLWTANNETDGDIPAAVEKMKSYRQGIIDDYVAGRAGGQRPTPPAAGVAANQSTEIASFDDARKATEAFLRAQRAEGP